MFEASLHVIAFLPIALLLIRPFSVAVRTAGCCVTTVRSADMIHPCYHFIASHLLHLTLSVSLSVPGRKRLARRLLFDRSASDDHERSILTKLKQQFGRQFTSKMEGMVSKSHGA